MGEGKGGGKSQQLKSTKDHNANLPEKEKNGLGQQGLLSKKVQTDGRKKRTTLLGGGITKDSGA